MFQCIMKLRPKKGLAGTCGGRVLLLMLLGCPIVQVRKGSTRLTGKEYSSTATSQEKDFPSISLGNGPFHHFCLLTLSFFSSSLREKKKKALLPRYLS